MLRVLPFVLGLALSVYCLIDCARTPDDEVRGLPKIVWVFVILLFPLAGGIGWLIAGRPRSILSTPVPGTRGRNAAPKGPDDDPDFLKRL